MISMTDTYKQSKGHSDTIINDITKILNNNKVNHKKINKYEIVVEEEGYSKDAIHNILTEGLTKIPEGVFSVLIDVTKVSGVVHIRQKTK